MRGLDGALSAYFTEKQVTHMGSRTYRNICSLYRPLVNKVSRQFDEINTLLNGWDEFITGLCRLVESSILLVLSRFLAAGTNTTFKSR